MLKYSVAPVNEAGTMEIKASKRTRLAISLGQLPEPFGRNPKLEDNLTPAANGTRTTGKCTNAGWSGFGFPAKSPLSCLDIPAFIKAEKFFKQVFIWRKVNANMLQSMEPTQRMQAKCAQLEEGRETL